MDLTDAIELVTDRDRQETSERAQRLVEMHELLGTADLRFTGQAANWLFDDVKATWIYGFFTSTIVTAHAFCCQQLAGELRLLTDANDLPASWNSLDDLGGLCEQHGLIDIDLRSRLVSLGDTALPYRTTALRGYDAQLERHLADAEHFTDGDALIADARAALRCSVHLLRHQR